MCGKAQAAEFELVTGAVGVRWMDVYNECRVFDPLRLQLLKNKRNNRAV
jgi:hypothetical protein